MESLVDLVKDVCDLKELADYAKDVAISDGVVFRMANTPNESDSVQFAPFMLFPSPIPKALYHQAVMVQRDFNLLVHKIAGDGDFLEKTLEKTVEVDPFLQRLWHIYQLVHKEGVAQKLQLGIHRSDYMIDVGDKVDASAKDPSSFRLTQIEINTIASAFGGLSTRLQRTHQRILNRVNNVSQLVILENAQSLPLCDPEAVPKNPVTTNLAKGLNFAVDHYLQDRKLIASAPKVNVLAILFVLEYGARNKLDMRLLEYAVDDQRRQSAAVGVRVVVLGKTLREAEEGILDEKTRVLTIDGFEVSVVYFRTGYSPDQYPTEMEWQGRLKLERSLAVKCPSIGYHLVTSKKVQQEISRPGVLERFLQDCDVIQRLRSTFTGLYPLDDSDLGREAISKARTSPAKFVMKPQREGGANNYYGDDIPKMLDQVSDGDGGERAAYILMDRITPMEHSNVTLRLGKEPKIETVVSELGIFGVFLAKGDKVLMNEFGGHLLRTKPIANDEGGVAAGFACLDSPYVI